MMIIINLLLWAILVIIPLVLFFLLRNRIKITYRLLLLIAPVIVLGISSFVGIQQHLFIKKTLPKRNTIQFKTDYGSVQDTIKILEEHFFPLIKNTEGIPFTYGTLDKTLYINNERIAVIENYDSLLYRIYETKNLINLTKSERYRLLRIYLYLIDNGVEACFVENGIFVYAYKNNGLEEWEEFIRYLTIDSILTHGNLYIVHDQKGKLKLIEKI